jgi:hypothetical protein
MFGLKKRQKGTCDIELRVTEAFTGNPKYYSKLDSRNISYMNKLSQ